MHDSDQQPGDEAQEQQGFQPLYEFPPSSPLFNEAPQPAPITRILPEAEQEPEPFHEDARQGFIYPPPPSYYQNMVVPPQPPMLPPLAQSPSGKQVPNYEAQRPMQPGDVQTMYPPPDVPPFVPQPLAKKSRKWVWIVVCVLSVVLLTACGLCGWGAYTLFATSFQLVAGSQDVVNDYYTDLQSRNYTAAYGDLAPQGQISGLTQKSFKQQASKLDALYGPVVSFTPGQPSFSTDSNGQPDLSRLTITVNVKRTRLSYTALLTVAKLKGNWKITNYNRL